MTASRRRTILAFLTAPLAAPLLWWALLLLQGQSGATGIVDALSGLAMITLVAIPFAYGATLLLGLPVYLMIQRWSKLRPWHPVLVGAAIGAVIFPLTHSTPVTLEMLLIGLGLGTAVGATFWWLYQPRGVA